MWQLGVTPTSHPLKRSSLVLNLAVCAALGRLFWFLQGTLENRLCGCTPSALRVDTTVHPSAGGGRVGKATRKVQNLLERPQLRTRDRNPPVLLTLLTILEETWEVAFGPSNVLTN